jgi:hypothetical protein
MSILSELWAELTGAPHVLHVPIPWGVWTIAGFLGAAAAASIMRLFRRKAEQRPPAEGDR